jgi:hypothetical protein
MEFVRTATANCSFLYFFMVDIVRYKKKIFLRSTFASVEGLFSQLVSTAMLYVQGYPLFWGCAASTLVGIITMSFP